MKKSKSDLSGLVVGVDATNLRQGGGLTHLLELLCSATPQAQGIARVVVWSGSKTLVTLGDYPWLERVNLPELDQGPITRILWQRLKLSNLARESKCDLLFVPGGSYTGSFAPVVTMSQNLLPFEWRELRRYGCSRKTGRLMLLRWIQSRSFRRADGVIFLTEYAKSCVLEVTGKIGGQISVISHGLNVRFRMAPKRQLPISQYSDQHPFRVIYVSIIDQYKHQWHVVEAVAGLRRAALPIVLDLVGPAYPPSLARLNRTLARFDPKAEWVRYHGEIPYADLHQKYNEADLGIFASSCENMPNILLETMGAGLPIACSNRGPMPEILLDAGGYFDPENPDDIARVLRELIDCPKLRAERAEKGYLLSERYSWKRCAEKTFGFLAEVGRQYRTSSCAAS